MTTDESALNVPLLVNLAQGAVAETLTESQRMEIHVETPLDEEYLKESLGAGKHVVLTGNPGDGKTQYILRQKPNFENMYTCTDASVYSDYSVLLDEWQDQYQAGEPAMLAINDGPLHQIISRYEDDYSFLSTIDKQLNGQVVYDPKDVEDTDFDQIIVINLNNLNILSKLVISQLLEKLTSPSFEENHDHSGSCQIKYNIQMLRKGRVQESLETLLVFLANREEHITMRDLINFVAFLIVGDNNGCKTDFNEEDKYFNLAYEGRGLLFEIFEDEFKVTNLTHPFLDHQLWMDAEEEHVGSPSWSIEEVQQTFLSEKRRFIFESDSFEYEIDPYTLTNNVHRDFHNTRNGDQDETVALEKTIRRINKYFKPQNPRQSELRLWFSHRYHSKNSKALVSRNRVSKHAFQIRDPEYNPQLKNAFKGPYPTSEYALEYQVGEKSVRLEIDESLHRMLGSLELGIPYAFRGGGEEQKLFGFMRQVEHQEMYSESEGSVMVKDTESGQTTSVRIANDRYDLDS